MTARCPSRTAAPRGDELSAQAAQSAEEQELVHRHGDIADALRLVEAGEKRQGGAASGVADGFRRPSGPAAAVRIGDAETRRPGGHSPGVVERGPVVETAGGLKQVGELVAEECAVERLEPVQQIAGGRPEPAVSRGARRRVTKGVGRSLSPMLLSVSPSGVRSSRRAKSAGSTPVTTRRTSAKRT